MTKLKPLLRWVIGPMSYYGLKLFKITVKRIKKIYGNKFDYLICHNNNINISDLLDLNVNFFDQSKLRANSKKYDVSWKLFPIRLRKSSHELVIDSDILVINKISQIDIFLQSSNHSLVYEGLYGNYGIYKEKIPINLKLNSGIYGMPPGFDFHFTQREFSQFDEQGLICSHLIKKKYNLIPLSIVPIIDNNCDFNFLNLDFKTVRAIHFVGVNGGYGRNYNPNFKKYLNYESRFV